MSDQNGREVPARQATARIQRLIEDALIEHGLTYTQYGGSHGGLPGVIVELPGERKLTTNTLLSIGEHSVRVEAFVCRKPDENFEGVYRFLLKRNRRLYGVAYTLDNIGDIYLIGGDGGGGEDINTTYYHDVWQSTGKGAKRTRCL